MNLFFQILNFLGVFALATLCAIQWHVNSIDARSIDRLTTTCASQSTKITDQANTIKGNQINLDDLRQQITTTATQLKDTQTQLTTTTAERDQLKAAVDKWAQAVTARDETIKQASAQIQKLTTDRNDAVGKFNELVGKYNQVVKDSTSKPKS